MFCWFALAVLDTLVWQFEIPVMASLFEINGDLRCELVDKIVDGRMGAVFRVYRMGSEGFAKEVAIKVLHERFAMQRQFIENFIGEGKLVAELIHPQIVQIYNFGDEGKSLYRRMGVQSNIKLQGDQRAYYMVMEFIRGVNLAEFIRGVNLKARKYPGRWLCLSRAALRAAWPTRTVRKTPTASRLASCIAMSARAAS